MSSGPGARRGPKAAHCPRGAAKKDEASEPRVRSKQRRRRHVSSSSESAVSTASSKQSSKQSSRTEVSTVATWNSRGGFLTAEQTVMAPDMTIQPGDNKQTYHLKDKGKFVVINRKDGEVVYMLRCVDGRRVFIEKTKEGAALMITDKKGRVTKALSGVY